MALNSLCRTCYTGKRISGWPEEKIIMYMAKQKGPLTVVVRVESIMFQTIQGYPRT